MNSKPRFKIAVNDQNRLTPIAISGVIVPWDKAVVSTRNSDYKLVGTSGLEYFLIADEQWRGVFSSHSWEEVQVVGLLDAANLTIIPQKVFPKGPKGEKENVIDLAQWKRRETLTKIAKKVNELVLVPTALLAMMS